jgi:hypothetical protein
MAKFKVHGVLSVTLNGKKLAPNSAGFMELTEAEAAHLGQVYKVEREDGYVAGPGNANLEQKADDGVSREALMLKTNAELDEVMASLGQKVDADASKGDKVERILRFMGGLDQLAEKDKAKNRGRGRSK